MLPPLPPLPPVPPLPPKPDVMTFPEEPLVPVVPFTSMLSKRVGVLPPGPLRPVAPELNMLFSVPPLEPTPPFPPIAVLPKKLTLLRVTDAPLLIKIAPPMLAPPPLPSPPFVVKFCSVALSTMKLPELTKNPVPNAPSNTVLLNVFEPASTVPGTALISVCGLADAQALLTSAAPANTTAATRVARPPLLRPRVFSATATYVPEHSLQTRRKV